jgi:hypothetical protein
MPTPKARVRPRAAQDRRRAQERRVVLHRIQARHDADEPNALDRAHLGGKGASVVERRHRHVELPLVQTPDDLDQLALGTADLEGWDEEEEPDHSRAPSSAFADAPRVTIVMGCHLDTARTIGSSTAGWRRPGRSRTSRPWHTRPMSNDPGAEKGWRRALA